MEFKGDMLRHSAPPPSPTLERNTHRRHGDLLKCVYLDSLRCAKD